MSLEDKIKKRKLARQIVSILVERGLTIREAEEVFETIKTELKNSKLQELESSIYD